MRKPTVMVVDDSADMVDTVARYLGDHGYQVEPVTSGAQALHRLETVTCDVVLTDLRMPDLDGLDLLEGLHQVDPQLPVIIMTAFGSVESAVDAIQRGAYHYLTKPFKMAALQMLLERAMRDRLTRQPPRPLKPFIKERLRSTSLVGSSTAISELKTLIQRVADAPSPVLIVGETGTGKETVARAVHAEGERRDAPFVVVDCAALPEMAVDSDLFGQAEGGFSGTSGARRGFFVEAEGGTLFLDEVGDLPLALQAELLRILQMGEVRPVGSAETRRVNARCIASTQRDLYALVKEGRFREDLYFRLSVLPIRLVPLRERHEDLADLVDYFLGQRAEKDGQAHTFTREARRILEAHLWPGNVRELENLVERLVVTCPMFDIDAESVRAAIAPISPVDPVEALAAASVSLVDLEQRYAEAILRRSRGNKAKAASILGIDVSTLYRRDKQRRS
jgi:two-component system response regulator HydG